MAERASRRGLNAPTRPGSATVWARQLLNKTPEITISLWIIKVFCTTVGETAADYLNEALNLGLTGKSKVRFKVQCGRRWRRRCAMPASVPTSTVPKEFALLVSSFAAVMDTRFMRGEIAPVARGAGDGGGALRSSLSSV